MTTIFYGAGEEARKNFAKWADEGLSPVCFADADINKHHTKLFDVDILPLDEAIKLYPDYKLCVTLGREKLKSVTEWLVEQGIPAKRIGYTEVLEWRRGCYNMDSVIHINPNFAPCCNWRFGERMPATGDWINDYKSYVREMNKLIDNLRNNVPCKCDNCPELEESFFYKEFTPKTLVCSYLFKGEVCNCNCCYCDLTKSGSNTRDGDYYLMDTLNELSKVLPERMNFAYTSAEISATLNREAIFDFLRKKEWTMSGILTNAIIYDEKIEEMLKTGSGLNVSLDSGTSNTYKKVKGVDCFDKVVSNIEKYYVAANCQNSKIELKYILLKNLNDNKKDIDGFLKIAKKVSKNIYITVDVNTIDKGVDESLWNWIEYFVALANEYGLLCKCIPEHMNEIDFKRIEMLIEE